MAKNKIPSKASKSLSKGGLKKNSKSTRLESKSGSKRLSWAHRTILWFKLKLSACNTKTEGISK